MVAAAHLYPRRIVCLTEETTETLYLLGEERRIVGISGFTRRPPRARKEKPKVSAFTSADIPKIIALEPDLVLAFSDLQADIVRELVSLGVEVMVFNQRSVAEILRAIVMLGGLVGRQHDAEALADRLARRLDELREETRSWSRRPRVFFEEWPDPLISGIRWVSELVEIAGGDDVCSANSHGSLAKDRIHDSQAIIPLQPDIIFASWCGKMVKPEVIVAREGWQEIPAVKSGRIYEIESTLILQPGPASLTDGVDALHRHLRAWHERQN